MVDLMLAGDFYLPSLPFPPVDDSVLRLIRSAEHSFVNLEGPVTSTGQRITKTGPAITSHPDALGHIASLGFTGVVTANNHILDAGARGLGDTLDSCNAAGLLQVGTVKQDHPLAVRPYLDLELASGVSVRVLAYCEREWSVSGGASTAIGWSVVAASRDVLAARAAGRRVVVVLHGGNEFFPLPRPRLRDELRFLAELGADAIVMHHNHVPSAYEIWHGTPICYGLGNFQFAMYNADVRWYEGLLAGLTFTESGVALDLTPLTMASDYALSIPDATQSRRILDEVQGHCVQVGSDVALEALWQEFTIRTGRNLLEASVPGGSSRLARAVRRTRLAQAERNPQQLLVLANVLRCDSLADSLSDYLWEVSGVQQSGVRRT